MSFKVYILLFFLILLVPAVLAVSVNIKWTANINDFGGQVYQCAAGDSVCARAEIKLLNLSSDSSNVLHTNFSAADGRQDYHAAYLNKECYVPKGYIVRTTGSGDLVRDIGINFNKKNDCKADIFDIKVATTPFVGTNGIFLVTVNSSFSSKNAASSTPVFIPGELKDEHYSSLILVSFEVLNGDGEVVFNDSEEVNILVDRVEGVYFYWTPSSRGDYTARVKTNVIDCTCVSSIEQIKEEQFKVISNADIMEVIVFNVTNNYYRENSYNQVSLSGEVLEGYVLPINQTCNIGRVQQEAIKIADPDVDFSKYSRLVIAAPYGPFCSFGGAGTLGKTVVHTDDGDVSMSIMWIYPRSLGFVVGHELGHNFGNHHASFLYCGNSPISETGCFVSEYGDPYSIMGNIVAGHYNAYHKDRTGWFSNQNILNVTNNGQYVIEPIENAGNGLKAIKIQRGQRDYLYVEYRQPIGADTRLSGFSTVFNGSLLHTIGFSTRSLLIDPSPPGNAYTSALAVGERFTDPSTGTEVTTVSKTPTALTVNVIIGPKTDFIPPSVNITYPPWSSIIGGVSKIGANASDASGIEKVEFYVVPVINNSEIIDPRLFFIDNLAPYEGLLDTKQLPKHTTYVYVYAIASDLSGQPFGLFSNRRTSNWHFLYVMANTTNSALPVVSITSPADGATVSGKII